MHICNNPTLKLSNMIAGGGFSLCGPCASRTRRDSDNDYDDNYTTTTTTNNNNNNINSIEATNNNATNNTTQLICLSHSQR